MDAFFDFAFRHRRISVCVGLVILLGLLAASKLGVKSRFDIEAFFPRNDQVVRDYYQFNKDWDLNDRRISLIAIRHPELWTHAALKRAQRAVEKLPELEFVRSVESLFTKAFPKEEEGAISVVPPFANLPEGSKGLATLAKRLKKDPLVVPTFLSRDLDATLLILRFDNKVATFAEYTRIFPQLESRLGELLPKSEGWSVHFGGTPSISARATQLLDGDLRFFILGSLLLVVVLLLLTFFRVSFVASSIIAYLSACGATLGVMALLEWPITMMTTTVPVVLMMVGLCDGVHLFNEFEKAIGAGAKRIDAVREMLRLCGSSCLATSVTTALGFASMAYVDVPVVRQYGLITAIGILLNFLATICVIPFLLALFPLRARAKRVTSGRVGFRQSTLRVLSRVSQQHRAKVILGGLLVAVGFAISGLGLQTDTWLLGDMKKDVVIVKDADFLESKLGGRLPLHLILRSKSPKGFADIESYRVLSAVSEAAKRSRIVLSVESSAGYLDRVHHLMTGRPISTSKLTGPLLAQLQLVLEMGEDNPLERVCREQMKLCRISLRVDDAGAHATDALIASLEKLVTSHGSKVEVEITGKARVMHHANQSLRMDSAYGALWAFLVTIVAVGFFLRSFKLALIAVFPNLFPILACVAALVVLKVPIKPTILAVFNIAIGIAVDDSIHFLTRFRYLKASHPTHSIAQTIEDTMFAVGNPMIASSIILVVSFSLLVFSVFYPVVFLGELSAIVVVSALLADLLVLPALLSYAYGGSSKKTG